MGETFAFLNSPAAGFDTFFFFAPNPSWSAS